MSLLKLETTVVPSEDKRKALLVSFFKTVAETIGKLDQCDMVLTTVFQAGRPVSRNGWPELGSERSPTKTGLKRLF
jgi:hypothetical protein